MSENDKLNNDDKRGEYFTKWIQENFIPCGIVYSTDKIKEILKKNNLTPSEFMRPFGDLNNIPFKIQINDYNSTINDFKIDFFDSEDFDENNTNLEFYLYNCLKHNNNIPKFSLENTYKNISDITSEMNYYAFNYFNEMEKVIIEHCYFCESELYQQPFCSVYLVSINDDIETIKNMKNKYPLLLRDTYEKNISTLILVFNDKSNEENFLQDNNIILKNLKIIKSLFNNEEVIYFEINGSKTKNLENNNIFKKYIHRLELYGKYFSEGESKIVEKGVLLTNDEINALKTNINAFIQINFRDSIIKFAKKIIDSTPQKDKNIFNIFSNKFKLIECEHYYTKKFIKPEKDLYLLCFLLFYLRDYKNSLFYLEKLENKIKKLCERLECSIVQLKIILKYICSDKKKIDFKEAIDLYISHRVKLSNKIPNRLKYYGTFRAFIILLKLLEDYDLEKAFRIMNDYDDLFRNFCCKLFQPLLYEKRSFYYLFFEKPSLRKFIFEILITTAKYFNQNYESSLIRLTYRLNGLKYIYKILKFNEITNPNYTLSFLDLKKFICYNLTIFCEQLNYLDSNFQILYNNISLYEVLEGQIFDSKGKSVYDLSNTGEDKKVAELFSKLIKFFQKNKDFLQNYSIPKIDQTSLILIKEGDLLISNNKTPSNYYESFSKFSIPVTNKKYSLLSNEDLYILKLTDMITNKKQYGNYFIKKEHIINKDEEIIIHFDLINPLPIDIFAEDIHPIIENENLVECEHVKSSLQPKIRKTVLLKIKFKEIGKIVILGISLNIFSNIRVKTYFKYPLKHSYLYDNYEKRSEDENLVIVQPKKRKRRKFSSAHRINYKDKEKNYSFEILEKDLNINISIPYLNEGIHLYQYELFYLPIKIINKYRAKIKKFTIFLNSIQNTIICPNYIYKQIDLNEEKLIQIPIIPKILGNNYLNIVIKFESLSEDIEIKSYMIKIVTHKSINIQVCDILMEKENLFERRRIIFDFDLQNSTQFTKMVIDNKIVGLLIGDKLIKSFEKELETSTNGRYYKEIEILFQDSKNKYLDDLFITEELIGEHNINSYIFYIQQILEKEKNIIYQFQLETKENTIKNFIYLYHPINIIENMNYQESYLKKILRESSQIFIKSNLISENENYINITLSINPKPFINFFKSNIFSLKIKINEESNDFIWIGLKEFLITDFSKETKMNFSFIYSIDTLSADEFDLNQHNLNQFLYEVTLNPLLKTVTFTNILKPIYNQN